IKDAYEDQEKHIYALEMGISSNPAMNWRVSSLDKYVLLANSDMHSLPKIGRDLNMFEMPEKNLSFNSIMGAMKSKDKKIFKKTLKYFPEEGRYHFDGHRPCVVSVDPDKYKLTMCPSCGKKLVIGVLHRVNDLADREPGQMPSTAIPYMSLVPLREVIAYAMRKAQTSVVVEQTYQKLINSVGTEYDILVETDPAKIKESSTEDIAQSIQNIRDGKITIIPGYAGVFGKVDLLNREPKINMSSEWKQKGLKQFEGSA
ncbi:MAG: endonuclease Q family protein, partial [Candidatus Micrarchaeales archaeon]